MNLFSTHFSPATKLRSADRLKDVDINGSGFVVRKRTPISALSIFFKLISACIIIVAVVWFYDALTGTYLCLGAAFVIGFAAVNLERMQQMQQSTEFLNALISSALGHGFRFSAIARHDGELVYVNRAFQELFPRFATQPSMNLATLCSIQNIAAADRNRFFSLTEQGNAGTVTVSMNAGELDQPQSILLSIQPIDFPSGYVLVRGA